VRRDVYLMTVAFWVSLPLFAVYVAVSWPPTDLGWPGAVLCLVVVVSSAYLTVKAFPSVPRGPGERDAVEWRVKTEALVYPIAFFFAVSLPALHYIYF
jgi:hypothetical protein